MKKYILILLILPLFLLCSCTKNTEKATELYKSAEQKIEKKDYNGAIKDLTHAIKLNPKYDEAYAKRGEVKGEFLKQYKEAMLDLDKAIKLKPQFASALHSRGICKISLGQYKESIDDFSQAIKINPNYPIAYNSRGVANGFLGNYKEAIKDFTNSITVEPTYENAYMNRAYAELLTKDYDKALTDAQKAKELLEKEKDNTEKMMRINMIIENIKAGKTSSAKK